SLQSWTAWLGETRSWTSCSSSTSSPTVVRRCSNSFGTARTYRAGSQTSLGLVGPLTGGAPGSSVLGAPDVAIPAISIWTRAVRCLERRGEAGLDLLGIAPADVAVQVGGEPALAPQQLVERRVVPLPLDIPECHIDTAHGIEQHRPVAPVGADVRRLPDILDL